MRAHLAGQYLALALVLTLAACGSERKDPSEATPEAPQPSPALSEAAPTDRAPSIDAGPVPSKAVTPAEESVLPTQNQPVAPATTVAAPSPAPTRSIAAGPPAAFAQCLVCHSASAGAKHKIGPNLFGVVGRRSATSEGFNYSPALQAADMAWTKDNLNSYLQSPTQFIPGTKMMYPGQKDAAKRAEILDYLASLK